LEYTRIVLAELRAVQARNIGGHVLSDQCIGLGDLINSTLELCGDCLLQRLEEEAPKVVALEKGVGIVDTAGQVCKIDASVGVNSVGVATQAETLGVGEVLYDHIGSQAGSEIWVLIWASVPVLYNIWSV